MKEYLDEHVVSISQPAPSKVSKELRPETLSLFYGGYIFMFTAFKYKQIFDAPSSWLKKIGKRDAALVRKLMIVLPYAKDASDRLEIKSSLYKRLKGLGCEAEVKFMSYEYGRCRCETCVLRQEGSKIRGEE